MFSLILTFCTPTTCEEYVIDHNLTRTDCKGALIAERNKIVGKDNLAVYASYMEQVKAEGMVDVANGVTWELSCSK
jgi:hypothetical protein